MAASLNTSIAITTAEEQISSPMVSVIIRTYNRIALLKEAIKSVQDQTFSDWELIIVDDGSTDSTKEIINTIKDPRISLLTLPHTGHINYLINEGVKKCTGKWIAFLDSDDLWLPEKLEMQIKSLQSTGKKWCYCPFEFVDDQGNIIYYSNEKFAPFEGNVLDKVIIAKTGITICSVIVDRKFFEEIGKFSPDPALREDYEFFLRIASKAEVALVPQVLTRIREHAGRVYKSRKFPYERTASAYKQFINQKPGIKYERLARRQLAFLLSEAAVQRITCKDYKVGIQQLFLSLLMKDKLRHWLSAVKRGLLTIYKHKFK